MDSVCSPRPKSLGEVCRDTGRDVGAAVGTALEPSRQARVSECLEAFPLLSVWGVHLEEMPDAMTGPAPLPYCSDPRVAEEALPLPEDIRRLEPADQCTGVGPLAERAASPGAASRGEPHGGGAHGTEVTAMIRLGQNGYLDAVPLGREGLDDAP